MNAGTVLVTGVHAEELAFGDRVVDGLESDDDFEVLRIPEGLPQRCPDVDQQFYYRARQRELYLQLHQQVRRRYDLLIDLHSGLDESGAGADVFCHDPRLLECVGAAAASSSAAGRVRLIRIIAAGEPAGSVAGAGRTAVGAHTSIPEAIWAGGRPLYVGLEIYLPDDRAGMLEAEALARGLIADIRNCGAGR